LEELVLNDLLGPAGGAAEEVTEQSVATVTWSGCSHPLDRTFRPNSLTNWLKAASEQSKMAARNTPGRRPRRCPVVLQNSIHPLFKS